jgi:hypothetical protein
VLGHRSHHYSCLLTLSREDCLKREGWKGNVIIEAEIVRTNVSFPLRILLNILIKKSDSPFLSTEKIGHSIGSVCFTEMTGWNFDNYTSNPD